MADASKNSKTNVIEVGVDLGDFTEDQTWPRLAAYAFSDSGHLLSKEPLERVRDKLGLGRATLQLGETLDQIMVKIGPDLENPTELAKYEPAVEKVAFKPGVKTKAKFEIYKTLWHCWIKVPYLVRGRVEKQQGGSKAPICVGEVDIYDVDVGRCFCRMPPFMIEHIRDSIIDIIIDPPPIDLPEIPPQLHCDDDDWCGTKPWPPSPPAADISGRLAKLPPEWYFAKHRFEAVGTARKRMADAMLDMAPGDKRAMLNTEFVEAVSVSKIVYSNTAQFQKLLVDHFPAFRFWLCWYPWIYWYWWPWCWWYSLEKLGTASLNSDGSFSKLVLLSICRNDTPDLWFVVRQKINGVERVIYARHPVPCNTYWNHPNGKPVNLLVTDPAALICRHKQPVDCLDPYVMPLGVYEDEWYNVHQAHIKPPATPGTDCGLYRGTDPYGTRLDLRMQFHDGLRSLPGNGVWYYRWSHRRKGTSGAWQHIATPIAHRYLTIVGGEYVVESEDIGPHSVGTEPNLYRIPDPNKAWLANRNDLAFAIWYTALWDAQQGRYIPQVADGKYELKLEMFDKNGSKVKPSTAGFLYILMTGIVGVADKNLHVQGDGSLILNIHIDNADTVADIKSLALNGKKAQDCQFLEYEQVTDTVEIEYVAYHPNNYLHRYSLGVRRGISNTLVHWVSSTTPASAAAPATESMTVANLLRKVGTKGPYTRCAFTVYLHTWPRTRDGRGRIRAYEAGDTSAFTLNKKQHVVAPLPPGP
jgi:hypothetical protein